MVTHQWSLMHTVISTTLNPLPDTALVHFMPQEKLWLVSTWTGERSHPVVPGTCTFEVDPLGLVRWGHYSVHGCTVSHECAIRLGFGEFEARSEPWTLYHLPWVIPSFIFYYHLSNAGSWKGLKPIPASLGKDRVHPGQVVSLSQGWALSDSWVVFVIWQSSLSCWWSPTVQIGFIGWGIFGQ